VTITYYIADGGLGIGTTNGSYLFLVDIHTVSEANRREHWASRAKRVAKQRSTMTLCLMSSPLRREIGDGLVVALTRVAPRALDDDNLRGALKACRDGVADWLGIDDRDPRVTWEYGQRRGAPTSYSVQVEVRAR